MRTLKTQAGVTLMEVLITMVIVLFGLIGLSQLFLKAQRTTADAYDRHRALALGNQMVEMMRSMVRLNPVTGAATAAVDECPTMAQVPENGVLNNEQIMDCFVTLSRPGAAGAATASLGILRGDADTDLTRPAQNLGSVDECIEAPTPTTRCTNRDMVVYYLNNWTEMLANVRQTTTPGIGEEIFFSQGFRARGCIDQICDAAGNIVDSGACPANGLEGLYRVRVFWVSDEPIAPDADINYCGVTANEYMRFTFVDFSLPLPPT